MASMEAVKKPKKTKQSESSHNSHNAAPSSSNQSQPTSTRIVQEDTTPLLGATSNATISMTEPESLDDSYLREQALNDSSPSTGISRIGDNRNESVGQTANGTEVLQSSGNSGSTMFVNGNHHHLAKERPSYDAAVEGLLYLKDASIGALDSLLRKILADPSPPSESPNLGRSIGNQQTVDVSSILQQSSPESLLNAVKNNLSGPTAADAPNNLAVPAAPKMVKAFSAEGLSLNNNKLPSLEKPNDTAVPRSPTTNRIFSESIDENNPSDRNLATAIASLLEGIYSLLGNETTDTATIAATSTGNLSDGSTPPLENSGNSSHLKKVRSFSDLNDGQKLRWMALEENMRVISSLCAKRSAEDNPLLPTYNDVFGTENGSNMSTAIDAKSATTVSVTSKDSVKANQQKEFDDILKAEKSVAAFKNNSLAGTVEDIDRVLRAMDRLSNVVPQLDNQRVVITASKEKAFNMASAFSAIERLSKGRLETQRAGNKRMEQDDLASKVTAANARDLSNQRVILDDAKAKKMVVAREFTRLNAVLERLSKNRMANQDWQSPAQLRETSLDSLRTELIRLSNRYNGPIQHFELSPRKEREMFMNSVITRVDKLNERRLANQDSDGPKARMEKKFQEVDQMMDRMQRMGSDRLEQDQRWSGSGSPGAKRKANAATGTNLNGSGNSAIV